MGTSKKDETMIVIVIVMGTSHLFMELCVENGRQMALIPSLLNATYISNH